MPSDTTLAFVMLASRWCQQTIMKVTVLETGPKGVVRTNGE